MRDETLWDKTDGVPELRGRLDKIRECFEAASEAPAIRPSEMPGLIACAQTINSQYESELKLAEEGFERSGGGFGGGQFTPPRDNRFSSLLSRIKFLSMTAASLEHSSDKETDFARIDEAIATHRKP